jgi:hypothetical protein
MNKEEIIDKITAEVEAMDYSGSDSDIIDYTVTRCFQLSQSRGMRWVKATERMPDKDGIYTVVRKYCNTEEKAEFIKSMNTFTNYEGYRVDSWLDESDVNNEMRIEMDRLREENRQLHQIISHVFDNEEVGSPLSQKITSLITKIESNGK